MKLTAHLERRLEKCMPQWLDRIHKAKYVADLLKPIQKKNYLNIQHFNSCMVGEIYNFNDEDYLGCKNCERFSIRFYELISAAKLYYSANDKKFNEGYQEELEFILKPFLKHLRETHPKVYHKCKKEKKF